MNHHLIGITVFLLTLLALWAVSLTGKEVCDNASNLERLELCR